MPTYHPFLERLQRGPILCDGGMGTELYARGISYERCFEQLNLTKPELVKAIHLDYATAGAEIIETNTFGANRYRLAEHGLERNVRALNRAGAKIAREARELSERPIFLAGSIGPLGSPLAPLSGIQASDARDAFCEQAEALLEAGEGASQVGVEMIKEVFDALCSPVQGTYIMTLGRYDLVGEVLPHIRLRAQAKKFEGRALNE